MGSKRSDYGNERARADCCAYRNSPDSRSNSGSRRSRFGRSNHAGNDYAGHDDPAGESNHGSRRGSGFDCRIVYHFGFRMAHRNIDRFDSELGSARGWRRSSVSILGA
jgi:hypothetical protein